MTMSHHPHITHGVFKFSSTEERGKERRVFIESEKDKWKDGKKEWGKINEKVKIWRNRLLKKERDIRKRKESKNETLKQGIWEINY